MPMQTTRPVLVAHVLNRFAVGGLENGVVNLINRMDGERRRHAVIALTDVDESFARRIARDDVRYVALHKTPGPGIKLFPRLWRAFRELRPALVHTRNLAGLEAQAPAWAAGVQARVHSEHGRDVDDVHLTNPRHIWTRRAYRPFVQRYVALSRDLADYLDASVGVQTARLVRICNGVDAERFRPAEGARAPIEGGPFNDPALLVLGTVGRMQTVKAQPVLARAFVELLQRRPDLRPRARLVMVGDGPLRAECHAVLEAAGFASLAWLPGERDDVPALMRGLSAFVLPSLAEGISNTILEAMASGLPVVATRVGGNADLVDDGVTGTLVEAGDPSALARGIAGLADAPERAAAMGRAARAAVEQRFSLGAMVAAYEAVYQRALANTPRGS